MKRLPTLLSAFALALAAAPLASQTSGAPVFLNADSASVRTPKQLCFKGAPIDRCRYFMLTEYSRTGDEYGGGEGTGHKNNIELGVMRNLDERSAVGMSVFTGVEDRPHRGVAVRYRRWLNSGVSVDLAPGVMAAGGGDGLRLTGTAAFSLADYVAVFVQGETGDNTVTAGVRVGALPGLIAGTLAAAIGALVPRT